MFDPATAALFPLPLTAFERYMLRDDRPGFPMTFPLRLRLSGPLNRRLFEAAFEETLSRHPLLCALARQSARLGPVWTLAEELRPAIVWSPIASHPNGLKSVLRGERIDLKAEAGLRAWVRQGDGESEVTFQFHHACCDGGGSLRFLGDLLAAYGARVPSAVSRPAPWRSDPASLVGRGRFIAERSARDEGRLRTYWTGLRDAARWLLRRPAPLCSDVPPTRDPPAPPPFLEMFRRVLPEADTRNLLGAAARRHVTVNDLLLRDIFLTLRQWNAGLAPGAADRWIRIAAPVKLKTRLDPLLPAANGVSYNFITRRESRCEDRADFLQGIGRENHPALRNRRGRSFLKGFRFMEMVPGATQLMMREGRCFATSVLSNLGDVGRFFRGHFPVESGKIVAGNVVLEDVFGAPPVRPNTHASFGIGTYAGRLWICLRRDPRALTAEGAARLLGMFAERITRC